MGPYEKISPGPDTPPAPPFIPTGRAPEWLYEQGLINDCAHELKIHPARRLLRLNNSSPVRGWIMDRLVRNEMIQVVHVQALRMISGILGNPLLGKDATAIDLAHLAVAEIQRLRAELAAVKGAALNLLLAAALIFGSWHQATARFWQTTWTGYEFILRDKLGGHHDRVCGEVVRAGFNGWDFDTIPSGGAKGEHKGEVESLDEAKGQVERWCR